MELTKERKAKIDSKDHYQLLQGWRFASIGDPMFQGDSGDYWGKRMAELKAKNPAQAVANSKDLSF